MALNEASVSAITAAELADLLRIGEQLARKLRISWDLTVDVVTEVVLRTLSRPERQSRGFMTVCIWHELLRLTQGRTDGLPRLPGAQRRREPRGAA